jgi:splicing factor 3B subunit 2
VNSAETPALYTVVPEKRAAVGGAMLGSSHVYDLSEATGGQTKKDKTGEGIEVSLDPSELELDQAAISAK